jgi:hypothetical protein
MKRRDDATPLCASWGAALVTAAVLEMASGVHAAPPRSGRASPPSRSACRVVAQRERLTRCGYGAGDRVTLRALHGRRGALDCPTDPNTDTETGAGLVDDVVAVRTMRAARIAGRRTRPHRAVQCTEPRTAGVGHVLRRDSEEAGCGSCG